jgi:hypothetical protein
MSNDLIPADLLARIRARAGDPARRSGASALAANSVSLESLLSGLPPIRDEETSAHVERTRGLLANVMSMFGGGAGGGPAGFAVVGPGAGTAGGFVSFGGAGESAPAEIRPLMTADLEAAEAKLGFALPPALRQAYLEIGDGGFGPGDGLYSLAQLGAKYREMTKEPVGPQGQAWPAGLIPINGADWDLIAIDRDSGRLVYWDVEALADEEEEDEGDRHWAASFRPEAESLAAWLAKWVDEPTHAEQTQQWEDSLRRGGR